MNLRNVVIALSLLLFAQNPHLEALCDAGVIQISSGGHVSAALRADSSV